MDAMNDYAVAPWVALAVIALVIGWQCIAASPGGCGSSSNGVTIEPLLTRHRHAERETIERVLAGGMAINQHSRHAL